MKKIVLSIIAATTLFSCSQDQDFTPSSEQDNYNAVAKQSVLVGDGSIVIGGSRSMARANSRSAAASQVDFKDVVLICNDFVNKDSDQDAEGSFAIKNSANANTVYLGKNGNAGRFYIGDNFTGNYTPGGNFGGETRVGDKWFDDKFATIQNTIDAAMATESKTGYYLNTNGTQNTNYPYTYYELNGVKYIIAEYNYIDGSVDVDGDGKISDYNSDAFNEWTLHAPWQENVTGGWSENVANNYVLIPKGDLYIQGRNILAHIYAPGKKVHASDGGAPTGLVVCDKFITSGTTTEIHKPVNYNPPYVEKTPSKPEEPVTPEQPEKPTPEQPEKPTPEQPEQPEEPVTPEEPKDDCDITIHVDVNKDFIIQADDFAIHNGDILYERIKNAADHKSINDYVVVDPNGNINISLNNIDGIYNYYKGKPNYISANGTLTVECWIWPSKVAGGEIKPLTATELGVVMKDGETADCDENYAIGKRNAPALYGTDKYDVYVSAFKSIQGNDNSSAIHVSFHIKPKN